MHQSSSKHCNKHTAGQGVPPTNCTSLSKSSTTSQICAATWTTFGLEQAWEMLGRVSTVKDRFNLLKQLAMCDVPTVPALLIRLHHY